MKTNKNIKLHACFICVFLALTTMLFAAKSQAKCLMGSKTYAKISADTSSNNSYKNVTTVQRNILSKEERALERLQLLDRLSKQPAENPEAFSNAREEYLYFEKARADLEEHDNAIKELNILMSRIIW